MTSTRETSGTHPTIEIRRAEDRFHTQISWLDSRHSFSFSNHYDPANTHHGLLLVSNDDHVAPNTGFRTHPHQDMEIVTWGLGRGTGAQGFGREQRSHLPRTRPADERRDWHLA